MGYFTDTSTRLVKGMKAKEDARYDSEANQYLTSLQKAAYSDAGAQYGQGLDSITRYLAGAGPLADGGAPAALKYRLASQVYGGANRQILGSYAEYLKQLQAQRRAYYYQQALLKLQKKQQSTGIGGFLGGAAGAVGGALLGGPAGAYAGYQMGSNL